jgi:hypothetical protein
MPDYRPDPQEGFSNEELLSYEHDNDLANYEDDAIIFRQWQEEDYQAMIEADYENMYEDIYEHYYEE